MSDAGFATLDSYIHRLRTLPGLARRAAPDCAEAFERELQRQIRAGTTPDGESWEPRQDGGKALETAAKALTVVAAGPRVVARLRGHIARHHLGRAKGGVQRQILPIGSIPRAISAAIREVLAREFRDHMGGR